MRCHHCGYPVHGEIIFLRNNISVSPSQTVHSNQHGSRYRIIGKGPAQQLAAALNAQGFNEGKPFIHEDIHFAVKNDVLYATAMGCLKTENLL